MTISQDMRSASMVRPARHRQDALMELTIAFEGGIFGSLVVGHMHVARKGNLHWVVRVLRRQNPHPPRRRPRKFPAAADHFPSGEGRTRAKPAPAGLYSPRRAIIAAG